MLTRHLVILALVFGFLSSHLLTAQSCHWDPDKRATYIKCYKFKKNQQNQVVGIAEIVYEPWSTKYFDYRRSKSRDVEEKAQTYDYFYFLSDNLFDLDVALERADAKGRGNNDLLEGLDEAARSIKLKVLQEEFDTPLEEAAIRSAILERLGAHVDKLEKAHSKALAAFKNADPSKQSSSDPQQWKAANATWENARKKLRNATVDLRNARRYVHDLDKIKISHAAGCVRPAPKNFVRMLGAQDHLSLQYDPENLTKVEAEDRQTVQIVFGILAGIVLLGSLFCGVVMKITDA